MHSALCHLVVATMDTVAPLEREGGCFFYGSTTLGVCVWFNYILIGWKARNFMPKAVALTLMSLSDVLKNCFHLAFPLWQQLRLLLLTLIDACTDFWAEGCVHSLSILLLSRSWDLSKQLCVHGLTTGVQFTAKGAKGGGIGSLPSI